MIAVLSCCKKRFYKKCYTWRDFSTEGLFYNIFQQTQNISLVCSSVQDSLRPHSISQRVQVGHDEDGQTNQMENAYSRNRTLILLGQYLSIICKHLRISYLRQIGSEKRKIMKMVLTLHFKS